MLVTFYKTGEWLDGRPYRTPISVHNRATKLNLSMSLDSKRKVWSKSKNPKWNTFINYGKILGCVISHAKFGAISRELEWTVLDGSMENMKYLDSIANNYCAISGLPITYRVLCRQKTATASLDRIDSSKGYLIGNVQWIHKDVNRLKMDMDEQKLFNLSKSIYLHNKIKYE